MKKKVPCIMLAYYNFDLIKATIDFLLKVNEEIDLIVLENKSENTEKLIKPYLLDLVRNKKILMYAEFFENITNNAYEEFIRSGILNLNEYEKIIFTDGDVKGNSKEWFYEEKNILDNHKEVLVCCADLKMHNLPVKQFKEAKYWIPKSKNIYADYLECATGMQLMLMRTQELSEYLIYMVNHNKRFKDSDILDYCYGVINKKWAKTKINKVEHLTWNIYSDLNNPYTKYKLSKSHTEHWYHDRYCDFMLHTEKEKKIYVNKG